MLTTLYGGAALARSSVAQRFSAARVSSPEGLLHQDTAYAVAILKCGSSSMPGNRPQTRPSMVRVHHISRRT